MSEGSVTAAQIGTLRKIFGVVNSFMVFMWKIGLGKMINFWPQGVGRIMVIKHRGRKTGRERLTPVNYAIIDGDIYCTVGFGSTSDWYLNMLANPKIELWLPNGKRKARAEDISDAPNRIFLLRQVLIASGFAGPLFGINQKKFTDEQLSTITKDYCLIHFMLEK